MKITVLIDNTAPKELLAEWGLSFLIEYDGDVWLLDAGASDRFLLNAGKLGIDLSKVDAAVLSHAHFDHADGMEPFFQLNRTAPLYLSACAQENAYVSRLLFRYYVGIRKGMLEQRKDRIRRVAGAMEIRRGVHLIPHSSQGLALIGRAAHLYVRQGRKLVPDDFAHEQSLVFETEEGLAVFNSCSHGGADHIVDEVRRALPGKPVIAYFGGLHLVNRSCSYVREYAEKLATLEVPQFYTGHCTGAKAYAILQKRLGSRLHPLKSGTVFELPERL